MSLPSVAVASRDANGVVATLHKSSDVTADTPEGVEILLRSASILVAHAVSECTHGAGHLVVRHGGAVENTRLAQGYFAEIDGAELTPEVLQCIETSVKASVESAAPIDTRTVPHRYLRRLLERQNCHKSVALLDSLNQVSYECHVFGEWHCLAHDHVVTPDSTLCGLGDKLELLFDDRHGSTGFWIRFRFLEAPAYVEGLTKRLRQDIAMTRTIDVVDDATANPTHWVEAEERRFTTQVNECAEAIHRRGDATKLVLISGPSASGKTTFSHRLSLALRALGRIPTVLSIDDYYRDASEETYPKQANGQPNHEVVECLRLDQFAADMKALFAGETVETPIFDMRVSKPKPQGRTTTLPSNGILIMEGIFALSPKLTSQLDAASMVRIFIVPLPRTSIDELTFVSNQTIREVRRIVRDFRGRGRDASASILRGPTVRAGEEQSIFPNMRHADIVFNSTMGHELAVLHPHCMTLLRSVKPNDAAHGHAQRLANLLSALASVSEAGVPPESLLREFIGGSVFDGEDAPEEESLANMPVNAARSRSRVFSRSDLPVVANVLPAKEYKTAPATIADVLPLANPEFPPSEAIQALCGAADAETKDAPIAALVNGELAALDTEWPRRRGACRVDPVFPNSRLGLQVARATLNAVVHAACRLECPQFSPVTLHGFGLEGTCWASAYYIELFEDVDEAAQPAAVSSELVGRIADRVKAMVAANTPVETDEVSPEEALMRLYGQGSRLSARLLNTCNTSLVPMVCIEGVWALSLQVLAPHAGFIRHFGVVKPSKELAGFAVCYATSYQPNSAVPPRVHDKVIEAISARRRSFCLSHGATCVADINRAIATGLGGTHRRLAAAIDGMQVADVVARVQADHVRVVFVAGASSSGKSVFADELQRHFRAAGVQNTRLSTDAFYKNLDDPTYPLTADGNKDCEHVRALRLSELGETINGVVAGKTVTEPVFNLGLGKRDTEAEGRPVPGLDATGVLIVEGLFALAPEIKSLVADGTASLGVMIAPLTVVSLDEQRFVSGQVLRILRRIVRDHAERGRDAYTTLSRWDSVAAGEAHHAVPHMFEADVVVSSTSLVEVHNLAARATALLLQVPPTATKEFFEARQLLSLLRWVHPDRD